MPLNNLAELKKTDISACNADGLVDLRNVEVNRESSFDKRMNDYIGQVHNPYLFKVGSTVVKVEFGNGKDFAQVFSDVILAG